VTSFPVLYLHQIAEISREEAVQRLARSPHRSHGRTVIRIFALAPDNQPLAEVHVVRRTSQDHCVLDTFRYAGMGVRRAAMLGQLITIAAGVARDANEQMQKGPADDDTEGLPGARQHPGAGS
jgi:hypothetical protein